MILHYKFTYLLIALQNLITKLDRRAVRGSASRAGFQARKRSPGQDSLSPHPNGARRWTLSQEAREQSLQQPIASTTSESQVQDAVFQGDPELEGINFSE